MAAKNLATRRCPGRVLQKDKEASKHPDAKVAGEGETVAGGNSNNILEPLPKQ